MSTTFNDTEVNIIKIIIVLVYTTNVENIAPKTTLSVTII